MKLKNYDRNQKKRKEYSTKRAFTQKNYCKPIIQWTSPTAPRFCWTFVFPLVPSARHPWHLSMLANHLRDLHESQTLPR